jgi:hypothetical protein
MSSGPATLGGASELPLENAPGVSDERNEPPRRAQLLGPRAALGVFVALEIVAVPLLVAWGHRGWFNDDDWDFLALRKAGDLGDLMRPHFGHWTMLPMLAYRLLWSMVGLRSYTPYLLLAIAAHLAVAALLRAVMRRAGIGPWWATLAAGVMLFFGAGAENALVAFQITFAGALAFGLGQLLLADHDGPFGRRDWLALALGLAGLLCSGIELIMVVVVGLVVLARHGWRRAAFHTAPLAIGYGIWSVTAPAGQSTAKWKAGSVGAVVKFVGVGVRAGFVSLGEYSVIGLLLALVVLAGFALAVRAQGRALLSGPAAATLALLVGVLLFLVLTGAFRSGQPVGLGNVKGAGPNRARLGRYVYVVAAFSLPAVALALQAVSRRWRALTVVFVALLAVGVPGNLSKFAGYWGKPSYIPTVRENLLAAAEISPFLGIPLSVQPQPILAKGVTLGWLYANRRAGKLPSLAFLTPKQIATETLAVALQPATTKATACRSLRAQTRLTLRRSETLTTEGGGVTIYLRIAGAQSYGQLLPPSTSVIAVGGPLRLIIVRPRDHPAAICTS